jgi:hypothetical protein
MRSNSNSPVKYLNGRSRLQSIEHVLSAGAVLVIDCTMAGGSRCLVGTARDVPVVSQFDSRWIVWLKFQRLRYVFQKFIALPQSPVGAGTLGVCLRRSRRQSNRLVRVFEGKFKIPFLFMPPRAFY